MVVRDSKLRSHGDDEVSSSLTLLCCLPDGGLPQMDGVRAELEEHLGLHACAIESRIKMSSLTFQLLYWRKKKQEE